MPNKLDLATDTAEQFDNMFDDDLLSISDVATMLDVSYITALHYVHEGHIQGIRRGRKWYIQPAELQRFKTEGNRNREDSCNEL